MTSRSRHTASGRRFAFTSIEPIDGLRARSTRRRAFTLIEPIDGLRARSTRRRAFTLIELLLVVVIAGIAIAVAAPQFAGSMKGAKLRAASRTVAMLSRYARNSAVLNQTDNALIFYPDRGEVEMVSVSQGANAADRDRFLDERDERVVAGLLAGEDDVPLVEEGAPAPTIASEMVRQLPDGVHILNVEVDGEVVPIEGSYLVNFYSNGMTDPFLVRLEDDNERSMEIKLDPLSGKVTVKSPQ